MAKSPCRSFSRMTTLQNNAVKSVSQLAKGKERTALGGFFQSRSYALAKAAKVGHAPRA
jgi:hypothetical protein